MTRSIEEAEREEREQRQQQQREQQKTTNGHAKEPRFKLLSLDDLDVSPDDDWVIDSVLPSKGVGTLYGRYKTYKSFVALDMAWAVADVHRADWGGRRILRHGIVVYIVCEGRLGMRKRLLAMKAKQVDELPPLMRIEARPNLGMARAGDAAEIVNSIRHVFPAEPIALVVVDTVARTLFREETNETLAAFLDNCEDVSEALGCLVLAVHHEGVDPARPRGGTMLPAGTVVQLHVKRQRGQQRSCQVFVEEAKDTESGFGFTIDLQSFEFGDEHSERRDQTLIVDKVTPLAAQTETEQQQEQDQRPRSRGGRPNRSQPLLSTVFNQSLDRFGIELQLPDNGPRVKAVNRDLVRTGYMLRRPNLKGDDAEREFRKAINKAIEGEQIIARELSSTVWLWPAQNGRLL